LFGKPERYICYSLNERSAGDKENNQVDATIGKLLTHEKYIYMIRALIYVLFMPKLGIIIARNLASTKI
jgi:hypothetical protein